MSEALTPVTVRIEPDDVASGFRCGKHALDDYFARHALANDHEGIGVAYVLRRAPDDDPALPRVLGYYTISMATLESAGAARVLGKRLPKYPMPAALIGRLASDERARGLRVGETLLMDALARAVEVSRVIACLGVIADAKDEGAEAFYAKYQFATVQAEGWPRRMFLPIETARAVLDET
jgi:hypothetical protein